MHLQQFENQQFGQNNRRRSSEFCESPPAPNGTVPGIGASESSRPPQCTVEVHGLPPGATEDLVTNYFENVKKSKGGPVSAVVMEPELQKCLVTFESPDGMFVFIYFYSSAVLFCLPRPFINCFILFH